MLLEEEIKQKKFRSEYHKLAVNIIYTHGWLMSLHNQIFLKFDLTVQQYNILRILRGQFPQPSTINLLKERMLDKMSDASRLVDRLEQKKLVERKRSTEDRRRADVLITKSGLNILEKIDPFIDDMDIPLENLTHEEAKKLNLLLDKLRG